MRMVWLLSQNQLLQGVKVYEGFKGYRANFLLIYSLQSQVATAYTYSAGTTLIGFFDVSVDGVLYDVTFVDGTYDAVFGSLPLTFSGVTEARTALDALDDAIAQYPAWGDHTAGTPMGISPSSSDWGFFLPYEITPSDLVLALILQHDNIPDIPNTHMFIGTETSYDTKDSTGGVWAKWALFQSLRPSGCLVLVC